MLIPEITRTPIWSVGAVWAACVKNELYTMGNNEDYAAMLEKVRNIPTPSDIGLYMVAKDIAEHSEGQTVANVMYILANEAVTYIFTLDGRDDI